MTGPNATVGRPATRSVRPIATMYSGSAPDSVCEFEFNHDCNCPDDLPMVGRAFVRMLPNIPGQCLVAAGNWLGTDDRTASRMFENMFETATATRIE